MWKDNTTLKYINVKDIWIGYKLIRKVNILRYNAEPKSTTTLFNIKKDLNYKVIFITILYIYIYSSIQTSFLFCLP